MYGGEMPASPSIIGRSRPLLSPLWGISGAFFFAHALESLTDRLAF
jgi:hypothetical protein